jgi:LPS-assembly lipoprotein
LKAFMQRRDFLGHAGVLGLLATSGCGFAPRRAPEMPFSTMAFNGFLPRSPMASQLRLMINSSRATRVIDDLASAEVILDVLTDSQERARGTITPAGQVRSINLLYRFKFRVRAAAGKGVLAPVELASSRAMTYKESQALAKEKEEEEIFRSMQVDLSDQVMRRLAAIKLS